MKMKGFDERINGPGKAAPKDWWERGQPIDDHEDIPRDVWRKFMDYLFPIAKSQNDASLKQMKKQSLAPGVEDYIFVYETGKGKRGVVSVEVRHGVVGDPVVRAEF